MSNFRLSPSARADLREIWFYTSERWSESQADRYIANIEAACAKLAAGELVGRPAEEFREGYFRLAVESHFVFFTVPESGRRIDVMRIIHQKMDFAVPPPPSLKHA